MTLDDDTVIMLMAFLALASGVGLLFLGRQSGDIATAAMWGLANIFVSFGVIMLSQQIAIDLGFFALIVSAAMMWASMANFNARRIPPIWFVGGALLWAFVAFAPVADWKFGTQAAVFLAPVLVYLCGAVWELWIRRAESYPARYPLMVLLAVDIGGVVVLAIETFPLVTVQGDEAMGPLWPAAVAITIFLVGSSALVISLIKERTAAKHQMASQTDGLTGIRNRSTATADGSAAIKQAFAANREVSVVVFDLDHFKAVNDTFGHQTGDVVLTRFAEAMRNGLRPGDVYGRVGGEEFIAVIPGAGVEAAVAIADRVRRGFAVAAEWVDGKPVRSTVSAGVFVATPQVSTPTLSDMLSWADQSLYDAKKGGRNRISVYGDPNDNPPGNLVHIA